MCLWPSGRRQPLKGLGLKHGRGPQPEGPSFTLMYLLFSTWMFTGPFSLSSSFKNFTESVSSWAQGNQFFLTEEWAVSSSRKRTFHTSHFCAILRLQISGQTSAACTLALWPPSTPLEATPVPLASPAVSSPNRNDNEQLPRGRQLGLRVLSQDGYYCPICRWSNPGTERLGKLPQVNQLVVRQNPQRKPSWSLRVNRIDPAPAVHTDVPAPSEHHLLVL